MQTRSLLICSLRLGRPADISGSVQTGNMMPNFARCTRSSHCREVVIAEEIFRGNSRISGGFMHHHSPYAKGGDFHLTLKGEDLLLGPDDPQGFQIKDGPRFDLPTQTLVRIRIPTARKSPLVIRTKAGEDFCPMFPLAEKSAQFLSFVIRRSLSNAGLKDTRIMFRGWEGIESKRLLAPGEALVIEARPVKEAMVLRMRRGEPVLKFVVDFRAFAVDPQQSLRELHLGPDNQVFKMRVSAYSTAADDQELSEGICPPAANNESWRSLMRERFDSRNFAYALDGVAPRADLPLIGYKHFPTDWRIFDYHFGPKKKPLFPRLPLDWKVWGFQIGSKKKQDFRLVPGIVLGDLACQTLALWAIDQRQLPPQAFGTYRVSVLEEIKFSQSFPPGHLAAVELLNPRFAERAGKLFAIADANIYKHTDPAQILSLDQKPAATLQGLELFLA